MDIINKNQSDIINYRPDLRIDKTPSLNNVFDNSIVIDTSQNIVVDDDKSVTLSEFKGMAPSETLSILDEAIQTTSDYKEHIKEMMAGTKVGANYLNVESKDQKEKIAKENYENPAGTTYIESYIELDKIEEELINVRETYSLATYGEDIGTQRAKSVDDEDINKFSILESENDTSIINYTGLYYESMISNILRIYSHDLLDEGIGIIGSIADLCKSMSTDCKQLQILTDNFHKKQEILQNDVSKDRKTAYNVRVALKNAFLAIQDYEDSLDALNKDEFIINDIELVTELKRDIMTKLSSAILDLVSVTKYSTLCKSDIAQTLINKSNLRGYFIESL